MVLPSPEFTIYSIAYGSSLALLCLGLTLTYMTAKVPNFAHGTLAILGSAITLILIDRVYYQFKGEPLYYSIYIVAPLVAFLIVGLTALIQYLLILKPLAKRGVGVIGLMIATLAFDVILVNMLTMALYLAPSAYFGKLIGQSLKGFDAGISILGVVTTFSRIVMPFVAVALAITLHLFLTRTKFGIAMRASIENPSLARTLGIDVDKVYMVSWFLAGGLAGVSGSFLSFIIESVKPAAGSLVIVSIFAGSILGGLGSIYGALIGGFLVGFMEPMTTITLQNTLTALLGKAVIITQYQRLFSLLVVIVVLLLAPQGLTGLNYRGIIGRARRVGGVG
ncbi:MAG: branched-chain amino acid ABC transporter permease [Thermoprotei archaeon]|nr:branched-chain amino acid ABC transporter permease [Thermoprotei archaeon]